MMPRVAACPQCGASVFDRVSSLTVCRSCGELVDETGRSGAAPEMIRSFVDAGDTTIGGPPELVDPWTGSGQAFVDAGATAVSPAFAEAGDTAGATLAGPTLAGPTDVLDHPTGIAPTLIRERHLLKPVFVDAGSTSPTDARQARTEPGRRSPLNLSRDPADAREGSANAPEDPAEAHEDPLLVAASAIDEAGARPAAGARTLDARLSFEDVRERKVSSFADVSDADPGVLVLPAALAVPIRDQRTKQALITCLNEVQGSASAKIRRAGWRGYRVFYIEGLSIGQAKRLVERLNAEFALGGELVDPDDIDPEPAQDAPPPLDLVVPRASDPVKRAATNPAVTRANRFVLIVAIGAGVGAAGLLALVALLLR